MSRSRWVLEGEWSGYDNSQRMVAHREVIVGMPKMRAFIEKAHAINFMDGTYLRLTVRDAKPRERIKPIPGYTSLIRDCVHYGVTGVLELAMATEAVKLGIRKAAP